LILSVPPEFTPLNLPGEVHIVGDIFCRLLDGTDTYIYDTTISGIVSSLLESINQ